MLRPVAAGLMCLGLVTLGVTASRGQETGKSDLIAEGKPVAEGVAVPAGPDLVEIHIGIDGDVAAGAVDAADVEVVGEDVIFRSDDGKIVEKIRRAAPRLAAAQYRLAGGPAIDPAAREALDKVVAGLKDDAKRLQESGKAEEAQQKLQSIQAIEQLLNAPRRAGLYLSAAGEEIKKLHERIDALRSEAGRQPQDGEAHAKIQREMAELHRKLAELHRGAVMRGKMPGMPGQPANAVAPGGFPGGRFDAGGGFMGAAPGQFFAWPQGGMPPEAQTLTQKSAALMQAAAQLEQAGLGDQAGNLRKQADKLRAEAEKMRAKAQPGGPGPGGFGAFAGGPHMELQKTIHELQEQIQQLRKEVGELRELLQQRRP
jgi:DNA repair exonuclease SbcCD ATPase subunit